MANWDDAQLAEVVERRHGEENRKKNATQIVSEMFNLQDRSERISCRYANIFSKLWRTILTVGSGVVVSYFYCCVSHEKETTKL